MRVTFSFYNRNYRVDIKTYTAETAELAKEMAQAYVQDFYDRNAVRLTYIITGVGLDSVSETPVQSVIPTTGLDVDNTDDKATRKKQPKTQSSTEE